jgi:membrane protease YdiL (CAAX protease family)
MTDNRKFAANITIFFVFFALAALNIIIGLDFVRLTDNGIEIVYTLISQILCMGILPVLSFNFFYKKDGSIPREIGGERNTKRYGGNAAEKGRENGGSIPQKNEAGNAFSSLVMRLTDNGFDKHISLVKPKKQIVYKALLTAFCMLFINLVVAGLNYIIIQLLGFKPTNGAGTIYTGAERLVLDLVLVAALPAVFEELTFRGILLGAYKDSPKFGIFISAFLFALMHMNIQQFFYTFVGGLVFGYVVVKSRSIVPSMIIHFCINAFSVIRSYGYQHTASAANRINEILGALPALALYAVAVGMIYLMIRTVKNIDAGDPVDMNAPMKREPLKNYAFAAGAIVFGGLTTIFTFVWGVAR